MSYFKKLIDNNTGTSSKNFALVVSVIVSAFCLVSLVILLFIDLIQDGKIGMDLLGLSAVITAIGGTLAAILYGKVKAEINDTP